jgi:diguanylate cyclase (GGDEF)-like protein
MGGTVQRITHFKQKKTSLHHPSGRSADIQSEHTEIIIIRKTTFHGKNFLYLRLAEEIERAKRYGRFLSLLFVTYRNSNNKHPDEQKLFEEVDGCIHRVCRLCDVVVALGHSQFAIILPETSPQGGITLSERIRFVVDNTDFNTKGTFGVRLQASTGRATYPGDSDNPEGLLEAAVKRADGSEGWTE